MGEALDVFGRLFDERFASAAAGVYAYAPYRLVLGLAVASFLGLGVGWWPAILWAAAAAISEVAMLAMTQFVIRAKSPDARRNWSCVAIYAISIPVWSVSGVILWSSDNTACQLAGAGFFAGHLLYIQAHHAHSPGAALATLPAVLLPALIPVLIPHFHGTDQVIVSLAMSAVVLNALISMGVSLSKSRTLQNAQFAMQAASQAKSEFLARMSHEIRTPLNGVLGMAQALAAERDLRPRHRESLAVIRQSGESLLAVLNDVLDLSKVEAGRLELEDIVFDLEPTVRGAQETFAPQAAAKGLAFHLNLEPEAEGAYRGDPTRLRQIIHNLLSNAVKFTETGEVSLNVTRTALGLEIVVTDSGVGIAAEHIERIFGRFQQMDTSTTRRYGGSGLGLSICRELAGLMGGTIEALSEPNAGTRFIVSLPMARVTDFVAPAGLDADTLEAGLSENEVSIRVLAAEDNAVNQLVLKTLLAQVGIEPTMVADGAQAVEAWRTGVFDLVLMDIQMPVMDGMVATQRIRAAEAANRRPRTPILALTANAMRHQVAEYMAGGFDGHIAKPLDARRLYEAIAEAVQVGRADDDSAVA
ncbi:MAG: ATP-binding protein [Phenylobacterium sp.]|nr:ATP-binding protein [Phenylobacterium sp.]